MYSINFPNMFTSTRTILVEDHKATAQNLLLMLKSDKTSLFGDPYFGTILKRMLFEQNNVILQDLVIDEIYSSILTFMPQIKVKREDIKLEASRTDIYATIECLNLLDFQTNLYTIKLTSDDDI